MDIEIQKIFTKSQLMNGMIVETRKGTKLLVIIHQTYGYKELRFVNNTMWVDGGHYNEDLTRYDFMTDNYRDIMRVYVSNNDNSLENMLKDENLKLVWDRERKEKMTLAEIETKLGYKVELVESV